MCGVCRREHPRAMTSTLELQIRATVFTDQVMQTLLATPRPLPDPQSGMQLQRVRYRRVSLRHDVEVTHTLTHVNHGHDQGPGYDEVTAKQLQLAVDVTAEFTTEASIAAHPNELAPADLPVEGTLVFDLDVTQQSIGVLSLETTFRDLELGIALPSPAGVVDPKAWAVDQLTKLLDVKPIRFDLSSTLAKGQQFWNAGITLDGTGTALAIRAETQDDGNWRRWSAFFDGAIPELLHGADWAVVADPADVTLSIKTAVWDRLTQALGQYRVRTVEVGYAGQGDRAAFTVTPFIEVWEPVAEVFVDHVWVSFGITMRLEDGRIVIDVDASGVDDVADGIRSVIAGLVVALVPLVGWLAAVVLDQLLGALLDEASQSVAGALAGADGLPEGTTIEELERFRYRATVPFTAPSALPGAITTFSADADAVTIGGSWPAVHLAEGELVVVTSTFGRNVPFVECGEAGRPMLEAFDADPGHSVSLHAEATLSTTGTAPVSVDAVVHVQAPDPGTTGLTIDDGRPTLPTTLTLDAPGGLAFSGGFSEPVVVDVRTGIGVVRLRWDPFTAGLDPTEIQRLRTQIKANLSNCDAESQPAWWFVMHGLEGKSLEKVIADATSGIDVFPG